MIHIRPMQPGDAEAVRTVDVAAFNVWWQKLRGESTSLAPRTRQNVLYRLDRDPAGCFVAEEEGRVVGLIFSCTWGSISWFGTFAVLPEHQGRGVGKQLIAASLEYLRQDPQRLVGLETMPESPANLGLYLRLGFQPRRLTLYVTRPLPPAGQEAIGLPRWSHAADATRERWLADLREATGHIYPGLDYSKEIILTDRHGMGETLLLTDGGQAVGMAIVVLVTQRDGWGEDRATLHALALHPAHTSPASFRTLVAASEALASSQGMREMVVPVYTGHTWAVDQLLQWGYRVERSMVRLVLPETERRPLAHRWAELSRWAG